MLVGTTQGCRSTPAPEELPIYDGRQGHRLAWNDLVSRSLEAEVVILGEEHDDPNAHALQAALIADLLALDDRTAVSMEMLERDDQVHVDAWMADEIDTMTFQERSGSTSWGDWSDFYQPVLDAAKAAGTLVIAANAPRTFVRQARIDGYEALEALPKDDRALFDLPETLSQGAYWERFRDLMREYRGEDFDEELIRSSFSSQMVWDATMAASIASGLQSAGVHRMIHLIGRFHGDFEGGTIRELKRLRPGVRILVVSCVGEGDGDVLLDEDAGRADLVVYTLRNE
jgi:uncharacterized iron-regulated protein